MIHFYIDYTSAKSRGLRIINFNANVLFLLHQESLLLSYIFLLARPKEVK